MNVINSVLTRFCFPVTMLSVLVFLLTGCAAGLQPVDSPIEVTPAPSQAMQWQALDAIRQDNWFHVLNVGSEALDWRLRAIDSAVESIDMQTFIWDLDGSGAAIKQHLLDAAERGVLSIRRIKAISPEIKGHAAT